MTVSPLPALSARFGVVSTLPTVVLVTWIAFLWGSGAVVGSPDVAAVLGALAAASVAQVTIAGILGVAVGSVFHPFQFRLVRMLEGYWSDVPVLRRLQAVGIEVNRRRMRRLRRASNLEELAERYPLDQADLLPTAIGNAMRAAERSAGRLYGMDAVRMLDRIYPLASPTVSAVFEDRRNQLDVAARYCVLLGFVSVTGVATLATDGAWLVLPAVTTILTWACYRATLHTAISYGKGLRLIFDLHHADLIHSLGWRVPSDPSALVALGRGLQDWLDSVYAPRPRPEGYVGPAASAADAAGAEASAKVGAALVTTLVESVLKAEAGVSPESVQGVGVTGDATAAPPGPGPSGATDPTPG